MKLATTLIFLFNSSISFCQPQEIHGKINYADTLVYSWPGRLIIFLNSGDSTVQKTLPDSRGQFIFKNVNRGFYNVVIKELDRRKYFIADSVLIVADIPIDLNITYPPPCGFVYIKGQKPVCPKGHNDDIIPIVYGLPTRKTMEKAKNGLVHLGGCIVSDCDPWYFCTIHKLVF